jgi:hypothetical protein
MQVCKRLGEAAGSAEDSAILVEAAHCQIIPKYFQLGPVTANGAEFPRHDGRDIFDPFVACHRAPNLETAELGQLPASREARPGGANYGKNRGVVKVAILRMRQVDEVRALRCHLLMQCGGALFNMVMQSQIREMQKMDFVDFEDFPGLHRFGFPDRPDLFRPAPGDAFFS